MTRLSRVRAGGRNSRNLRVLRTAGKEGGGSEEPSASATRRIPPFTGLEIVLARLHIALAQLPHWTLTGEERWVPHAAGPVPHSELYRDTVRIQLATLDVGGISELDFKLVARIDALATRQGGR